MSTTRGDTPTTEEKFASTVAVQSAYAPPPKSFPLDDTPAGLQALLTAIVTENIPHEYEDTKSMSWDVAWASENPHHVLAPVLCQQSCHPELAAPLHGVPSTVNWLPGADTTGIISFTTCTKPANRNLIPKQPYAQQ